MMRKYLFGSISILGIQLFFWILLLLFGKWHGFLIPLFLIVFFLFSAVLCKETDALTHQMRNMWDYLRHIRFLPLQFLIFLLLDGFLMWILPKPALTRLCGIVSLVCFFVGMVIVYAVGSARTILFHE